MRIHQYAYFALWSGRVSAAEMTARLGIEPDEFKVRGRRTGPLNPARRHTWSVVCREPGLRVDELLAALVQRLRPHAHQLGAYIDELRAQDPEDGGGALQVVRYLGDEEGEEEDLSPADAPLQRMAGQHQLLGWTLEREVLEFLLTTNTWLDVDEYG